MFQSASRRDPDRRRALSDNIPLDCALRHVHWLAPVGEDADRVVASEWLARVERQLPLSMISTEAGVPKTSLITSTTAHHLELSGLNASPRGLLLVRVGKTKLVDWEDRSFQLVAQLGDQVLESCPVTKTNAGLQEYFILYVLLVVEMAASDCLRLIAIWASASVRVRPSCDC